MKSESKAQRFDTYSLWKFENNPIYFIEFIHKVMGVPTP